MRARLVRTCVSVLLGCGVWLLAPVSALAQTPATVIAQFDLSNGGMPYGGIIVGRDGNAYGLTLRFNGQGALFQVSSAGVQRTVGTYPCSAPSGDCDKASAQPGGLLQGTDGLFYFYVDYYDQVSGGVVYAMSGTGALTQLAEFPSGTHPRALTLGPDGALYGVTEVDPTIDSGSAFRVRTDGTDFTTVVAFDAQSGLGPTSLILGRDGNFYGLTAVGGDAGRGTFFRMTTDGGLTRLASFDSRYGIGGGSLIQGADGNFYATTRSATTAAAVITRFTPTGVGTVLSAATAFNGSGITQSPDGNFYGLFGGTASGSAYGLDGGGHGSLVAMTPNGTIVQIASVDRHDGYASRIGRYLTAGPVGIAADGTIYGATASDTQPESGAVFRVPEPGLTMTADPGLHAITLRWTYVRGATSYRIYRGSSPGAEGTTPIATSTANEYVLSGLANGPSYFTVVASGASGTLARSPEVSAVVNNPDPFSFPPATGVPPKVFVTSDPVTITGLVAPAGITVSNGRYSIDGGPFMTKAGTVQTGDSVRLQGKSAKGAQRTVTTTAVIGGVAGTFTITTGS